jgi:hypothetical protein
MTIHEGPVGAEPLDLSSRRFAASLDLSDGCRTGSFPALSLSSTARECKPAPYGSAGFCFVWDARWVSVPP